MANPSQVSKANQRVKYLSKLAFSPWLLLLE